MPDEGGGWRGVRHRAKALAWAEGGASMSQAATTADSASYLRSVPLRSPP